MVESTVPNKESEELNRQEENSKRAKKPPFTKNVFFGAPVKRKISTKPPVPRLSTVNRPMFFY